MMLGGVNCLYMPICLWPTVNTYVMPCTIVLYNSWFWDVIVVQMSLVYKVTWIHSAVMALTALYTEIKGDCFTVLSSRVSHSVVSLWTCHLYQSSDVIYFSLIKKRIAECQVVRCFSIENVTDYLGIALSLPVCMLNKKEELYLYIKINIWGIY